MNRTLLAIASPRNRTMVSMQKVARTISAARYPTKSIQDIGLSFAAAAQMKKISAPGPEALDPGAWASCDLTGALVSVGRRRHCGCRRFFGSVGRVLAQAHKRKYGQRTGAIDDQHTPGPISRPPAVFPRQPAPEPLHHGGLHPCQDDYPLLTDLPKVR